MRKRRVILLGCIVGLALVGLGTGGVSSMNADRSSHIDVVSDDDAFLGIEKTNRTLGNGTHHETLITVTNNFPTSLTDVDATVLDAGSLIESVEVSNNTPDIGDNSIVTATINCGNVSQQGDIDVHLSVESAGEVYAELTRQVTVECTG